VPGINPLTRDGEVGECCGMGTGGCCKVCVSADSKMRLADGRVVPARMVRLGDEVQVVRADGSSAFSTIYAIPHRIMDVPTPFICIATGGPNATALLISDGHLVFAAPAAGPRPATLAGFRGVPAGAVRAGDFVWAETGAGLGAVRVSGVSAVTRPGLAAPFVSAAAAPFLERSQNNNHISNQPTNRPLTNTHHSPPTNRRPSKARSASTRSRRPASRRGA
jgi:hypothetical protein